jgi:hypothetical protein
VGAMMRPQFSLIRTIKWSTINFRIKFTVVSSLDAPLGVGEKYLVIKLLLLLILNNIRKFTFKYFNYYN